MVGSDEPVYEFHCVDVVGPAYVIVNGYKFFSLAYLDRFAIDNEEAETGETPPPLAALIAAAEMELDSMSKVNGGAGAP